MVTHEETALSYTGGTSAVNGQSVTLSGVLSTDDPTGAGVVGRSVTFTLGGGSTAKACAGTAIASGAASCVVAAVAQAPGAVAVAASFAGDAFYQPASSPAATVTVTAPTAATALKVSDATGDFGDATAVSAVLTTANTAAPVGGQPVVFTLNGAETCTGGCRTAQGTATCQLTPKEAAGTYTLSASFAGADGLLGTNGTGRFVVTHEETALSYTGGTSAVNGQSVRLLRVCCPRTIHRAPGVVGRTVTFTLGGGSTAQACAGTTSASGAADCVVAAVAQAPGAVAVAASFAGDAFYQPASSPAATVAVSAPATSVPVKDSLVSKFNMNGKVKGGIRQPCHRTYWARSWVEAAAVTRPAGGIPRTASGVAGSAVHATFQRRLVYPAAA